MSNHPAPFAYHQEEILVVEKIDSIGMGVAHVGAQMVKVPFVLPGEKVRVRIYKNFHDHSVSDLLEVIEPSLARVQPKCGLFGACGGCQYQHWSYDAQLRWKKSQVESLFEQIHPVQDVHASPRPYAYRSKITPHFQAPRQGQIEAIGFLKAGTRHSIVDVCECPIATEAINRELPALRERTRNNASTYKRGATLLLRDAVGGVETDPNKIIEERVGNLSFQFPAGEFFQNNPYILPDFAGYACKEAGKFGASTLVDAYCGSGLFGISAASGFSQVIGVEVSEKSLQWAKENAARNQLHNISFQVGDAERLFEGIPFSGADTVVLIDPPRKGCSEEFIRLLLAFSPKGIVYVSCNPETQARDVLVIKGSGYSITAIQPFDLFPHTRHIENIVTLARA